MTASLNAPEREKSTLAACAKGELLLGKGGR